MKANTVKLKYSKMGICYLFICLMGASAPCYTQEIKSMEASKEFKEKPKVSIQMYDTHTEIKPTKDTKISVQIEYVANGDNNEALLKIEQAMQQYLIIKSDNSFTISNNFFSTIEGWSLFGIGSQSYIKLNDGSKLKFKDFEFEIKKVKIYLPADVDLIIESKYGTMDLMIPINGTLMLQTYDLTLNGKSVSGNLTIDGKYSKFRFDKVGEVNMTLYESYFDVTEMGKATIDSKYSNINSINSGSLIYKGYEDKINIQDLPNASLEAKYSHIRILNLNIIKAEMYEGSLKVKKSVFCNINSKYVQVDFGKIGQLNLVDGYENHFEIEAIDNLISVNGKYNDFKIGSLFGSVKMDGYEESLMVEKVTDSFTTINADGKYLKLKLILEKESAYSIKGSIQYPQLQFNRDEYKVVLYDKESDLLKFEYSYGKEEVLKKLIQINGYEINMDIKNL